MFIEALQDRLRALDDEILRLTKLASESSDKSQQDNYWLLARDLQREARGLRSEIRRIAESTNLPLPSRAEHNRPHDGCAKSRDLLFSFSR